MDVRVTAESVVWFLNHFEEVAMKEARFAMLARSNPTHAAELLDLAQRDIDDTWHYYEQLAGVEREVSEFASL